LLHLGPFFHVGLDRQVATERGNRSRDKKSHPVPEDTEDREKSIRNLVEQLGFRQRKGLRGVRVICEKFVITRDCARRKGVGLIVEVRDEAIFNLFMPCWFIRTMARCPAPAQVLVN
jgi:hypothetical protein